MSFIIHTAQFLKTYIVIQGKYISTLSEILVRKTVEMFQDVYMITNSLCYAMNLHYGFQRVAAL